MSSITSAYNSAFPALNIPGISQRRKSTVQQASSLPNRYLAPPKYPSYLKKTLYAKLVYEQYQYFQHKHDVKPNNGQTRPTIHQPVHEEHLEHLDLRLPSFWNSKDKSKNIEVGSNGLDLSYVGLGKQDTHAALVRSNFPMRPQCGIFYYEAKVISKGDDGYIGIGFCSESNKLERLPGWDPDSYGYHGDDGYSFAGSGSGKPYGPCFTTGDIIGCGVNFADNTAFYTKNGSFLGNAFTNINTSKPIYPAIGLRTAGEEMATNFGNEPFVFDIEHYIHDQKIKLTEATMPADSCLYEEEFHSEQVLHQLILSYLIHHGYTGTAKAVVQNSKYVNGREVLSTFENGFTNSTENDMEQRQLIRSAIINGQIDEAISLICRYFPGLLEEEKRGRELQLQLKCGKFVEMMRRYCEKNKSRRLRTNSMGCRPLETESSDSDHLTVGNRSKSISGPSAGKSRRLSYASIAATLSPSSSTEMMDIDSHKSELSPDHLPKGNIWTRRPSIAVLDNSHEDHLKPTNEDATSNEAANYLKLVMKYGQQLQEEYHKDTRDETRSRLVEIFSLLAYPDPESSPVAYLLNTPRRDALATEVNAAILAFKQQPEVPVMERIYSQIVVCNDELAWEGNGKATLINIEEYCKNNIENNNI